MHTFRELADERNFALLHTFLQFIANKLYQPHLPCTFPILHTFSERGTTFSDMDARLWHFLGSQRVELKARPFFLLALRTGRPREVGFY